MPNIPLNQYARDKTPIGRTADGRPVYPSQEYWVLIDLIIKRLGGSSALSVADLEGLGILGSNDSIASEVLRSTQEAKSFEFGRTFPEVEKKLQDALILAVLGTGGTSEAGISEDEVQDAGSWEPVSNADTSTPDILFDAATADVCVTFVS